MIFHVQRAPISGPMNTCLNLAQAAKVRAALTVQQNWKAFGTLVAGVAGACLSMLPAAGSAAPSACRPGDHFSAPSDVAISCALYVSPEGSDAAPGSLSAPWRTAQHAFDSIRPGQTICFRSGNYPMATRGRYSQTLSASGTSLERITVMNYPGERAILHGSTRVSGAYVTFVGTPNSSAGLVFEGPTGPGSNLDLIDVMNTHDVTFDHVEIRKGDYHAGFYQFGGHHIQLIGAYIHDNGRPGYINVDNGVYWDETRGEGSLIANCVVARNVGQGIALYASSSENQPEKVIVEGNTIVQNGHYGLEFGGSGNSVVNNILWENGKVGNSPQMKIAAGTSHVVDSNLFWSVAKAREGIYNVTGQRVTHSIVQDVLFVDPASHDYHLQSGSPAIGVGNANYSLEVDREGNTRTKPPDLGAYQHVPPRRER